jgi:hypothetical protein
MQVVNLHTKVNGIVINLKDSNNYYYKIYRGVLYNEDPFYTNESFDYEDFDKIEENWIKYEGSFSDDNKEGNNDYYYYRIWNTLSIK